MVLNVAEAGRTVQVVAMCCGLNEDDLTGRSRLAFINRARQVAMYLLIMDDYRLREVGEALGGRTPATITHGFQRIAREIRKNKRLDLLVERIKEEL